jgi:serine/threonine-protein kinase
MSGLLNPGDQIASYSIHERLGSGGTGTVFLATQLLLDRKVALKVLAPNLAEDAAFRERFVHESRVAAGLHHPNLVAVYDAGEANGLLYIAMQYIAGGDLGSLVRSNGPLASNLALTMITGVGAGLDAAHATGLVHRDVKPANILISTDERVYVSDFGIARSVAGDGLTRPGSFLGTTDYCAPEQIKGDEIDSRADVYALGAVLFYCLAGTPPFVADNEVEVLLAHLQAEPPKVSDRRPDLSPEVDSVIKTAMAIQPADRFQTCSALVAAFQSALAPTATAADQGPRDKGSTREIESADMRPTVLVDGAPKSGETVLLGSAPESGETVLLGSAPESGETVLLGSAQASDMDVGQVRDVSDTHQARRVVEGAALVAPVAEVASNKPQSAQDAKGSNRTVTRRRAVWAGGALLAIVGGVLAFVLLSSTSPHPEPGGGSDRLVRIRRPWRSGWVRGTRDPCALRRFKHAGDCSWHRSAGRWAERGCGVDELRRSILG